MAKSTSTNFVPSDQHPGSYDHCWNTRAGQEALSMVQPLCVVDAYVANTGFAEDISCSHCHVTIQCILQGLSWSINVRNQPYPTNNSGY